MQHVYYTILLYIIMAIQLGLNTNLKINPNEIVDVPDGDEQYGENVARLNNQRQAGNEKRDEIIKELKSREEFSSPLSKQISIQVQQYQSLQQNRIFMVYIYINYNLIIINFIGIIIKDNIFKRNSNSICKQF